MNHDELKLESWRDRKRRETLRRITEVGLKLFSTNGYDETTLDMIAESAGISRRTFFHYFNSKEDILLAWQNDLPRLLHTAILQEGRSHLPIITLRNALEKLDILYDADVGGNGREILIYRILRSNAHLRAGNQAKHLELEQAGYDALCELWPEPESQESLRIAAMIVTGLLRLSLDRWAEGGGNKARSSYLAVAFDNLPTLWGAAPSLSILLHE